MTGRIVTIDTTRATQVFANTEHVWRSQVAFIAAAFARKAIAGVLGGLECKGHGRMHASSYGGPVRRHYSRR